MIGEDNDPSLVVWRFTDGKPGHEKQTAGLLNALQRIRPLLIHICPPKSLLANLANLLIKRRPKSQRAPDLVLGAGHATQWPLLVAGRATGARTVVLMNPVLPTCWFDLCFIPDHDAVKPADNIILTLGAINTQQPPEHKQLGTGMVLIGGPSRHFDWDEASILQQVQKLICSDLCTRWQITNSRRTPDSTTEKLSRLQSNSTIFKPFFDCASDWLDRELQASEIAWVSADSVSMIYEALSAGCQVGIIDPGSSRRTKLTKSFKNLLEKRIITTITSWQEGGMSPAMEHPLNEASRCAHILYQRFFDTSF